MAETKASHPDLTNFQQEEDGGSPRQSSTPSPGGTESRQQAVDVTDSRAFFQDMVSRANPCAQEIKLVVTAVLNTPLEAMDEVLSKANSFLPDILGRHRAQAIILSDAMSDHETPLHRKEFIETFLSLDIPHA